METHFTTTSEFRPLSYGTVTAFSVIAWSRSFTNYTTSQLRPGPVFINRAKVKHGLVTEEDVATNMETSSSSVHKLFVTGNCQ